MDPVADSDTENSLPPISVSDVNVDTLRNVLEFFSEDTRARILAEAENTPLAALYESTDNKPLEHEGHHRAGLSESALDAMTLQQNGHETRPECVIEEAPTTSNDAAGISAPNQPTRRSRSLRKRTFASRHPYIADQADWLGICTVDSINEMFDGDDDISRVARALNQLYLQKKRRYPDEDRYRLKDFYTHLGHIKILALEGDPDASQRKVLSHENAPVQDLEEREYDPELHSSQIEQDSAEDDDKLFPFEDFEIPYTQEPLDEVSAVPPEYSTKVNTHASAESFLLSNLPTESSSESESEPEKYIKVGGRYRKIRTILRGVLPESAKRLGMFDSKTPAKRRKTIVRPLTPRRGLAIRKSGSSASSSAELERELYLDLIGHTEESPRKLLVQPSIVSSPEQKSELSLRDDLASNIFERPSYDLALPALSRASTSLSYDLDVQAAQYVSSGSGSESEQCGFPNLLSRHDNTTESMHVSSEENSRSRSIETNRFGTAEEFDEINHLLASRDLKPKHSGTSKIATAKSGKSLKATITSARSAQSIAQGRLKKKLRVPLGKPATTKLKPSQRGSIRLNALDKIQTRLPAFRLSLQKKHHPITPPKTPHSAPNKSLKQKTQLGSFARTPIQQHFKRNPLISTLAIEAESTSNSRSQKQVVYDSDVLRFHPTRQSLLGLSTSAMNSLTGLVDSNSVPDLCNGRIFFANEDSVSIQFLGKNFHLALYSKDTSFKNLLSLLNSLRRLFTNPTILTKPEVEADTRSALGGIIKWLLICREKQDSSVWAQLRSILDAFSKLQLRDVRQIQLVLHSQLIYICWIIINLEHGYNSTQTQAFKKSLLGYSSDFFVLLFSTLTAHDLSTAYMMESANHDLFEAIMIVFTIHEKEPKYWWPPIIQALDNMVFIGTKANKLLDLVYLLGAIIPKRYFNWGPLLLILNKLKTSADSSGHRHFIETCALAHQRLEWPLEEKLLTQLYSFFGNRKFLNFVDEVSIPSFVGVVHSIADIPQESTFEKFLGLLYNFISDLSLAKDVKKLILKLLASSQYQYVRGRKSQIMFANRLNMIVLLSQISDIDLGNQLANLVLQICDSGDAFVYGRSLDALQVLCEKSFSNRCSKPVHIFIVLFKSLTEMIAKKSIPPSLFQKLLNLMGETFRGDPENLEEGAFGLLQILSTADLSKIPESSILELLGTVLLSIMEVEILELTLNEIQSSILFEFQKSLLKLLSAQMDRLPISDGLIEQTVEDLVELAIQIWMLTSKINKTQHWNNMMYQKYTYLGNSISRNRFVMFLCLEFIQYAPVDSFELQEIEKVFLNGMISPKLSKYSFDLYCYLSQNENSIFRASASDITSNFSLQTFRLRIITRAMQNIVASSAFHINEKVSAISVFVKCLHDVYTDFHSQPDVFEMCKRVTEVVLRVAKDFVADLEEFWELSSKLGFPNRSVQNKWFNSNNAEKVHLLNQEFVSALVYGKSYVVALDNWRLGKVDILMCTLLQVYTSALTVSTAYWAHVSLLLEYVYIKLKDFEIKTDDRNYLQLLNLLKDIAYLSNHKMERKYIIHEIRSLKTCASILKYTYFVFDGYMDQVDIKDIILEFLTNVNLICPRRYKPSAVFMDITIDQLQSGSHVSYHPNHQHTTEDFQEASTDLRAVLEDLVAVATDSLQEEMKTNSLDNFLFF